MSWQVQVQVQVQGQGQVLPGKHLYGVPVEVVGEGAMSRGQQGKAEGDQATLYTAHILQEAFRGRVLVRTQEGNGQQ